VVSVSVAMVMTHAPEQPGSLPVLGGDLVFQIV
jgi:hypothetical protein